MKITENKPSESVIEFIIELDRPDIEADLQKAAKHLAEHSSIPGFRPGKAPYDMVCRHAGGEAKIYEEALDAIIRRTLPPIIIERKLETTGRPDISVQKMVPPFGLTYKAIVNLLPQVELGDVAKIQVESKPVTVDSQEAEKIIAKLRQEKEAVEKERFEMACMEELLKISKVGALPEPMIAEETEKMLHELEHSAAERGGKFEDYLQSIKKTKKELAKEFRPRAEHRLRLSLIVRAFDKKEDVKIEESEVEKEIEISKKMSGQNPEMAKQFSSDGYREYVRAVLTSRKIFEILADKIKRR